jgi:hypothetical protein
MADSRLVTTIFIGPIVTASSLLRFASEACSYLCRPNGSARRLNRRCDDHGEAGLVQEWKNGGRALTPSLLLKVIVGMHRRCHRGRFRRNWWRIWRQRFWSRFWLRRCRPSGFWIAWHSDAHISLQHSITTGRECVAVSVQAASISSWPHPIWTADAHRSDGKGFTMASGLFRF